MDSQSAPFICAAVQGEGVVPSPQTCKQILFASAATACTATAFKLSLNQNQPIRVFKSYYRNTMLGGIAGC